MATDVTPSLERLATRIRKEQRAIEAALTSIAAHVMAAGDLLIEAKKKLPHGQWLPWLTIHCEISERTAQVYMQLARKRTEIEANPQRAADLTDLTVRKMLTMVAPPSAKVVEMITPGRIANPHGAPASEAFSMAALNVELQENILRGQAVLAEEAHKPGGVRSLLGMAADYVASFAPAAPLPAADAEAEALEAFANAIIEAHQDAGEDGEQIRDSLFDVAELLLLCEHPVRWAGYLRARGKEIAAAAESSADAQTMKLSGGGK